MTSGRAQGWGGEPGYTVGVMTAPVADAGAARFGRLAEAAVRGLRDRLGSLGLEIDVFSFEGPPASGDRSYPLDYLELGLTEKLERRINFLLIVTEGDVEGSRLSYALAYPSRLTNVGVISSRRLLPDYWGEDVDDDTAVRRLEILMLHTLGHILNLDHHPSEGNAMYDFGAVEDLDAMSGLTPEQAARVEENLPREAHDETARGSSPRFWLQQLSGNWGVITGTLWRANPIRLLPKLPTLLTAALSVVVVLFFSSEVWEVADSVAVPQIAVLTVLGIVVATTVLYRTFGFGTLLDRERLVSESTVVTQVTTLLAVLMTVLAVFALFFGFTYLAIVTIFPRALMSQWAVDAATETLDHVNVSLFLATMAVVTGSLGGRGDSRRLVRTVLFLDEET